MVTLRPLGEPLRSTPSEQQGQQTAQSKGGCCSLLLWILGPLVLGSVVGLLVPESSSDPAPWGRLSSVIGWAYFFAWSVSFYPQVAQNCWRRSVLGLSLEYQLLNSAGFACYFAFNAVLYWSPGVQEEYHDAHSGNSSAVRLNDVVFAGHALFVTGVTLLQMAAYYDHPPLGQADRLVRWAVTAGLCLLFIGFAGLGMGVALTSEGFATWLTYLLVLSEVKVVISVVKYCPQVWMNYRRKSTDGWNIVNVILDFMGGLLSVSQLVLDGWATADWSAVTGDPAKFLLGNISMLFDLVFLVQHYCLYPGGAQRNALLGMRNAQSSDD